MDFSQLYLEAKAFNEGSIIAVDGEEKGKRDGVFRPRQRGKVFPVHGCAMFSVTCVRRARALSHASTTKQHQTHDKRRSYYCEPQLSRISLESTCDGHLQ